jgi:hypothetical protein
LLSPKRTSSWHSKGICFPRLYEQRILDGDGRHMCICTPAPLSSAHSNQPSLLDIATSCAIFNSLDFEFELAQKGPPPVPCPKQRHIYHVPSPRQGHIFRSLSTTRSFPVPRNSNRCYPSLPFRTCQPFCGCPAVALDPVPSPPNDLNTQASAMVRAHNLCIVDGERPSHKPQGLAMPFTDQ